MSISKITGAKPMTAVAYEHRINRKTISKYVYLMKFAEEND